MKIALLNDSRSEVFTDTALSRNIESNAPSRTNIGLLRFMYLYLTKHLSKLGENSDVILYVIMLLMIGNIIITCGVLIYYYYF